MMFAAIVIHPRNVLKLICRQPKRVSHRVGMCSRSKARAKRGSMRIVFCCCAGADHQIRARAGVHELSNVRVQKYA
eukprot:1157655-Pelagomonas_calceolata.AAC.3